MYSRRGDLTARTTTRARRLFAIAVALATCAATTASAQPATQLGPYVLFAESSLRARTALVHDGDLGVNDGTLYLRGTITAASSDLAADLVHLDSGTDCEDLFTNTLVGSAGSCPKAAPSVPRPLIANLPAACGYPASFPACNAGAPVLVDHNQTTTLPPGVYGDLVVEGGGAGPATLKLAGTYTFCSVRVGRNGSVLFTAPSTVQVVGTSRASNATAIGPDPSLGAAGPAPGAIKWFVQGSQARFSRKGQVRLHACAPNGKMLIGSGMTLAGRFVANVIRLKKSTVTATPPVPGVCGDAVVSPGEQCETAADCGGIACIACVCGGATTTTAGSTSTTTSTISGSSSTTTTTSGSPSTTTTTMPCDDDEDCPDSAGGVFICVDGMCVPGCMDDEDCDEGEICVDGHCVPGSSTTTTTTTTPISSTTTTLVPCSTDDDCPVGRCVDGFCRPECTTDADCNAGSPTGAFVCIDGRCEGGEVCGDCLDNDGDGLIDFEDAECCSRPTGQMFAMELRKGRFRPRTGAEAKLRLKGNLARSGLGKMINPPAQDVMVQIRSDTAGEVLCVRIPAGKFLKKRKGFRYSRKKSPLPLEIGRNLDGMSVKLRKSGKVRYRVKGKRVQLATPAEGTLRITVGFSNPGASASENVCSQAVRLFRGAKKGALRFP